VGLKAFAAVLTGMAGGERWGCVHTGRCFLALAKNGDKPYGVDEADSGGPGGGHLAGRDGRGHVRVAQPDGVGWRIDVSGLRAAVQVQRDAADVTHIWASTPQDAWFAMGLSMLWSGSGRWSSIAV
jgi:hypothetical protein